GDGFRAALQSPSTVHISATDGDGAACAITASAGYGSGVMPPGTGLWLNNCLGEHELNRRGLHAWDPGDRLPSNMAPTVARADTGASLAIGSPGADRITTAILQTVLRFTAGASLADAIAAPRVHVRHAADGSVLRVGYEEGLVMPDLALPTQRYHPHAMFFGGVTATLRHADGRLVAAADPRRGGGTVVSP
ncbi:MAG: gamma-glutamyltransferase family protein, partial [Actinobacteria bacterium]|nr:gamma-glutamyltransferase family protein [Actinomycetota bacterium]